MAKKSGSGKTRQNNIVFRLLPTINWNGGKYRKMLVQSFRKNVFATHHKSDRLYKVNQPFLYFLEEHFEYLNITYKSIENVS